MAAVALAAWATAMKRWYAKGEVDCDEGERRGLVGFCGAIAAVLVAVFMAASAPDIVAALVEPDGYVLVLLARALS